MQHRNVGKRKTIVIVAEGAHDKNLNPVRADDVKKVLAEQLGLDTRVTTLGHVQRGGRPCAWDRILVGPCRTDCWMNSQPILQQSFSPPSKVLKQSRFF